jgi:hypothetical protein
LRFWKDQAVLEFQNEAESTTWKERLTDAKQFLDSAIQSVGRIELTGSEYDWIGTGWLVHDNILVTNRHVANEFAERKGEGFTFRMGSDGAMTASVDFLQEIGNTDTLVFKLVRPLFINAEGPDVSFFEIEVASGNSKLARTDRPREKAAIHEERRGRRLSRVRQPHSGHRSHGAHLRPHLQQEAAGARRRHARRAAEPAARLHDARRQLRVGRGRPGQRRSARAALQRQVHDGQLRGALRHREAALG